MSATFGRVITAMVTPFDDRGELDLDAAVELANWLVENGSDGLVLCGTTGESPTLTESEELVLFRTVRGAVSVPVIAGAGSNSTATAVEQTRRASELGVDAILSVTPYYNRPSQAGLDAHFRAVAAATDLPVILYDIPVRTGRKIDTDTMLGLAHDVPNIVGVKDASGDPTETARLIASAPSAFEVYSGDDAQTLPLLAVGAVGVISVASHWVGRQMGEMIDAFEKGDVSTARRINAGLLDSYDYESSPDAVNPVPTKTMLRVLGLKVGSCRPPMGPAPDDLEDRARRVLDGLA
ncbi:MAG TPA: 4-hydroxy-tetrahydrodipicolinate synthase [Microthrixaceae bacterium]|nr:4-hydroxy-tetrahydrodipicolinate synthase [Microthrixaceae bacterium]MCB9400061.1 4-hydroxy-tetrahydrodipicolinate synthase [Microthrixaceae bacterium]MCO5305826.1 4-hydroxy-tetrahydrodipicolinate synthase [Microthrixaceae bacterium]HMR94233.1 4-hydroxy-tetrahydrodipicolinate synthase [Microthrixaceae bacterium]HMU78694.1 4-hydroxy-tetrahydrodipicolinate synthase [Microthrixaceae bacterium]